MRGRNDNHFAIPTLLEDALAKRSVMSTLEMYLERAAACREEAANTTLAKVRDRALRSATVWESMAEQMRSAEVYQRANKEARSV
jgi:hypothetical protein